MAILSHWLPAERLIKALQADHLPGEWRHWIPRAGKHVVGVCLGEGDHGVWHNPAAPVCVLIDDAHLPSVGVWHFNSQEVWELTEALKSATVPERIALAGEAKRNSAHYETDPTECFVEGGLAGIRGAIVGLVSIGQPPRRLKRLATEIGVEFDVISQRYQCEDDDLPDVMDEIVERVEACIATAPRR